MGVSRIEKEGLGQNHMDHIQGIITRLRIYEEEGRTDWLLSISKVIWFFIWILFPFSLFRFLYDTMGVFEAVCGVFILLLLFRLAGPENLVMLDELLCRIAPTFRSSIRFGVVRVYDFRIKADDGRMISCILQGDLIGSSPMTGDAVRLEGEMQQGCFRVRRGSDLTTGATLEPRSFNSRWILLSTLGLAAFFSFYLGGAFDTWIYGCIATVINMFNTAVQK
jgi:hypothetical protein